MYALLVPSFLESIGRKCIFLLQLFANLLVVFLFVFILSFIWISQNPYFLLQLVLMNKKIYDSIEFRRRNVDSMFMKTGATSRFCITIKNVCKSLAFTFSLICKTIILIKRKWDVLTQLKIKLLDFCVLLFLVCPSSQAAGHQPHRSYFTVRILRCSCVLGFIVELLTWKKLQNHDFVTGPWPLRWC